MINEKELIISNMSPTRKDFYQIYPEILDLVQKITERWDPTTSNESDPGVVLLKLLAFIADKNNYNIDKNILEAFMPSATQESSMRKLTEMMGYNMHYYTSATTKISFMYQGDLIGSNDSDTGELIDSITIKAFDNSVKDENDSINYTLLEDVIIIKKYEEKTVEAIEGSLNYCNVGNSNVIKIVNLDDNNRFYLPETIIAENGVFVKNTDNSWADRWIKVDNLNTQVNGTRAWKFGVDSNRRLPYIEFPEDISNLIEDGLEIAYVVTTGANGNVKAKVLTKLASKEDSKGISLVDEDGNSTIVIANNSATTNGADYETLDEAYNNFKRTVGTFDTLVTCRDYANKIYQLVRSSDNTTPLVSNIQVSDIRDDINRRDTIMTYGKYGLEFIDKVHEEDINHFDLYFYPFGVITGAYTLEAYKNSFRPSYDNIYEIESNLDDYKTIAHKINYPQSSDIYCLKNIYELKAKITTTYKVTSLEETQILNNIYTALYKKFNMRNVEFGEEISFDSVLECIRNADTRIKNVSLEEPNLTTKYMKTDGIDHDLLEDRKTYIDLITKNILAGRVPLFDYDDRFEYNYGETKFTGDGSGFEGYDETYGYDENNNDKQAITKISTEVEIDPSGGYALKDNEVIQMIAPNFRTTITYPIYVNYYLTTSSIILENQEYALKSGDTLYINYTDSDDAVFNIKYEYDKITTNGIEKEVDYVIIKPNFEMKDSATLKTEGKLWAKTTGFPSEWGIEGMFSVSTNQQIDIRDYVKIELKERTWCYWLIKDGTIPFDNNNEYILQDNEYFFYTNEAKTELVILGSGTKLVNNGMSPEIFKIDYTKSKLNIDSVSNEGLAAFANDPWKSIQFKDNEYLLLQEMQFITLTEGDILNEVEFVESGDEIINNDFKTISSATYTINGVTHKLSGLAIPGNSWEIRSRLDLNVGPSLEQKINLNQQIVLKEDNTEIVTLKAQEENGDYKYPYIKSNILLQFAGGNNITAPKIIDTETLIETYNLNIMVYDYKVPVYDKMDGETPVEEEATIINSEPDIYGKFGLKNYDNIKINILIPDESNSFSLLMVYYTKPEDLEGDGAKITSSTASSLKLYNNEDSLTDEIELEDGINVIKIVKSSELEITRGSDKEGILVIGNSLIVKNPSIAEEPGVILEGVNYKLLGLDPLNVLEGGSSEIEYLLSNISEKATVDDKDVFYYNCPIDNSSLIDYDDMTSPLVWYDYNNICNKFVISELDADKFRKGITLTKSSRL